MHGPSASLASPWGEYPTVPYVDSIITTLSGAKRRRWKRARNRAFRLWGQAGMVFERVTPVSTPAYDPNSPDYWHWVWDNEEHSSGHMAGDENAFMRSLVVPGAMHLLPMYENWFGGGTPAVGWMFETGSFAIFNMNNLFVDDTRYLACHEMGHALGLGHQYQQRGGSPTSVMYVTTTGYRGSSKIPDGHDIKSLVDYYAAVSVG